MGTCTHDLTSRRESAPTWEARPTATTRTTLTPRPDHGIMAGDYGSDIEIASVATLSDYGSDIDIDDDSLLADAFDTIRRAVGTEKRPVLPSIEFEEGEIEDEEHHVDGFVQIHKPSRLRVTRNTTKSGHGERGTLEVEYDERSRRAWSGKSAIFTPRQRPSRLTTNSD